MAAENTLQSQRLTLPIMKFRSFFVDKMPSSEEERPETGNGNHNHKHGNIYNVITAGIEVTAKRQSAKAIIGKGSKQQVTSNEDGDSLKQF